MSRHRNIRNINVDEEFDIDDVYGRSMEEEYCISPNTAAQFMYDRNAQTHSFSNYLATDDDIPEEDVGVEIEGMEAQQLNDLDRARLQSCMDEMCNVVGDSIPEHTLRAAIIANNFDLEKSLDAVLSNTSSSTKSEDPKPQRQRRGPRNQKAAAVAEAAAESPERRSEDSGGAWQLFIPNGKPDGKETSVEKEDVDNKFTTLKINQESAPQNEKGGSKSKDVPAKTENMVTPKQRENSKELLNLVIIGHVDAGKSTLMGHLLFLLGVVSKKIMHKYEQEAKKIGKTSFMYAWVLDETGEERNRGITMDVGRFKFETESKVVTLLDAPGHKDFIPNMITGAAQADVAILVVDATRGEFETGFESGGQTREHALLVRSLGVTQLVVAVNKLDTVGWSQTRFNEIVKKLGQFLKQVGFKEADISYVPCSGLTGENLVEGVRDEAAKKWYEGPTLLQQIDSFKAPERPVAKPFRMSVGDIFKGQFSGFCVLGRIETGFVSNGDRVMVMPQGETAQIKGITIDDNSEQTAFAGDQAVLIISNIDIANVTIGSVLCSPSRPIQAATNLEARIVIFNIEIPITKGFPVVFHYQASSEQAVVKKLISTLHKSTGEVIKNKPRCLSKNTSAVIELEIARPVCMELYKDIKELGRFMLRSRGSTIAAGLVTAIL